jgi:hypothetical protein
MGCLSWKTGSPHMEKPGRSIDAELKTLGLVKGDMM